MLLWKDLSGCNYVIHCGKEDERMKVLKGPLTHSFGLYHLRILMLFHNISENFHDGRPQSSYENSHALAISETEGTETKEDTA